MTTEKLVTPGAVLLSLALFHVVGAYGAADGLFLAYAFASSTGQPWVAYLVLGLFAGFCAYLAMIGGFMALKKASPRPVGYGFISYIVLATIAVIVVTQGAEGGLSIAQTLISGLGASLGAWMVVRSQEKALVRLRLAAEARQKRTNSLPEIDENSNEQSQDT